MSPPREGLASQVAEGMEEVALMLAASQASDAAVDASTAEPEALLPPAPGTTYKVLKNATVREGFDRDSVRVGKLSAGDVIEILEARQLEGAHAGSRVRFVQGWTSTVSQVGNLMLEPTAEEPTVTEASLIAAAEAKAEAAIARAAETVQAAPAEPDATTQLLPEGIPPGPADDAEPTDDADEQEALDALDALEALEEAQRAQEKQEEQAALKLQMQQAAEAKQQAEAQLRKVEQANAELQRKADEERARLAEAERRAEEQMQQMQARMEADLAAAAAQAVKAAEEEAARVQQEKDAEKARELEEMRREMQALAAQVATADQSRRQMEAQAKLAPAPSTAEEGVPPTLPAALRSRGYRRPEDLGTPVDEPVALWLRTCRLDKVARAAREAGLAVVQDLLELETAEVMALAEKAELTGIELRRLRRELRVLTRGGAFVQKLFAPTPNDEQTFQTYAKPDDILSVGGQERRVWVSPFVREAGGEDAVDREVQIAAAALERWQLEQLAELG